MKHPNSYNHHNYIEEKSPLLGKIVKEMKESLFNDKTTDIFEITFSYSKTNFNTTLFEKFGGIKESDQLSSEEIYRRTFDQVEMIKYNFDIYKKQLKNFLEIFKNKNNNKNNSDNQNIQEIIKILINSLDYHKKILELTQLGIPFEIEKHTNELYPYSKEEVPYIIDKMEKIESDLFGGNVRDNKMEVSACVASIENKLQKFGNKLNEEEKEKFEGYIQKAKNLKNFDQEIYNKSKEGNNQKSQLEGGKWDKEITREDYITIFKKAFEIYGIKKPVKISEGRSSIYDGENGLEIPSNKNYEKMKLGKILYLIQHEISTHYITLDGTDELLGGIKGAYNLNKEEGLAMTLENQLKGIQYNPYFVSISLPKILMGEILDGDEYDKFQQLFNKAGNTNSSDYKGRLLRNKRLYPIHYKGVQHKDTTYSRGQHLIHKQCIEKGENILDLLSMRGGIEDSLTLAKLGLTKKPLLISDIIIEKLEKGEIKNSEFKKNIKEKYKNLDPKQQTKVEKLNNKQKRNLIDILNIIKK